MACFIREQVTQPDGFLASGLLFFPLSCAEGLIGILQGGGVKLATAAAVPLDLISRIEVSKKSTFN